MNIIKMFRKNRILFESSEQKKIFEKFTDLDKKLISLNKKRKYFIHKKNKIDKSIESLHGEIKSLNESLSLINFKIKPIISIGLDKRTSTYNCIFDHNGTKYCFYIGNISKIKKILSPYFTFDLNNMNSNLLVKELKKIIIIVFDDLNTNNSIPNPKEINLDFIMSKYFKSGRWTNWRLIK